MSGSNTIISFPDLGEIKEQAALWVARSQARDLTHVQQEELLQWLKQSPTHMEEFRRLSDLWYEFDILDDLNYLEGPTSECVVSGSAVTSRRFLLTAVAASLVLLATGTVIHKFALPSIPTQADAFQTTLGEQETIALIDGSTMMLNTNSIVEVSFTREARDIHLIKGEVHVDVAHRPTRPFSVHAGGGIARAVGTSFTVRLHEANVEVTVAEGQVELIAQPVPDSGGGQARPRPTPKSMVKIAAGDNAVFNETHVEQLKPMTDAELQRRLSWRRGQLVFVGEPLSAVLAEVSRYTDVVIELDDASLGTLPIGGYFKVGEVEGLVQALEGTFDIDVEYLDDKRIRLSRGG
jgi:transmembrane sensor